MMRIHPISDPKLYRTRPRAGAYRGLTLIEVLIALLVLSIGLLGFAGLQANALKFNHSAQMRTVATNLAYDIADRMRANRSAAMAGGYNIAYGDATPTGTDIVSVDIQQWRNAVDDLPAGEGAIAVTGTGAATISIRWDDTRGDGGPTEFEMTTQL